MQQEQGFTLIELLIVVAIIGTIAAIAIPQFSAYRQRGYNSAAQADLRNISLANRALNAEESIFLSTNPNGTPGNGKIIVGPVHFKETLPAGSINPESPKTDATLKFGLSNGVSAIVSTDDANRSYVAQTAHYSSNLIFGADSDSSTVIMNKQGKTLGTPLTDADIIPSTFGTNNLETAGYTGI